ncbi:hypothetical protein OR221_0826 [Microbacterium laevaniformans OR221]|nr:hypothetical protein OR221_0826 [Microbacterium laevaniformans OR221]
MSRFEVAVIERYPDGGKWIHYFATRREAEIAVEHSQKHQPARAYEIVSVSA